MFRELTLKEFENYLKTEDLKTIKGSTIHHTWSPTTGSWRGQSTMEAIKNYHVGTRGFSTIAADFYVAPDGQIYVARGLKYKNGAHAYVSKGWSSVPANVRKFCDGNKQALNYYTAGFEIVGNYDSEDPSTSSAVNLTLAAVRVMHRTLGLDGNNIFFHRDVADKSCPGNKMDYEWFTKTVNSPAKLSSVVLGPDGTEIKCYPEVEDGRTRGEVRAIAEALGYKIQYRNIDGIDVIRIEA